MQLTPQILSDFADSPDFDPFVVFSFLDGFPKPLTGQDRRCVAVLRGMLNVLTAMHAFTALDYEAQKEVLKKEFHGTQLEKLFRQWLCREGVCDYGETPDKCFIDADYVEVLPKLITAMRRYIRKTFQ